MNRIRKFQRQAILALFALLWVGLSGFSSLKQEVSSPPITSDQLVETINHARLIRGLNELIPDSILMSSAQATVKVMAGQAMTARVAGIRERVMAAGYGNGDIAWADESVLIFEPGIHWQETLQAWIDDTRNVPVNNPDYRHIGIGTATSNHGRVYFVIQVAYTSEGNYQPNQSTPAEDFSTNLISEVIFSIQTVTPQVDGKRIHIVKPGQSLWSIAIAYNTHIEDLQRLNNISRDNFTIYAGQKLLIPPLSEEAQSDARTKIFTSASYPTRIPTQQPAEPILPSIETPQITQPTIIFSPSVEEKIIPETGKQASSSLISSLAVTAIVGVILIILGLVVKR